MNQSFSADTKTQARERYYGKNRENTTPVEIDGYPIAYRVKDSGVLVRELHFCAEKPLPQPIEIDMLTDTHIREDDHFIEALRRGAACASLADCMIFCGDNLDAVSSDRNVELFRELVWEPYPDALCLVGNHDCFYGDYTELRAKVCTLWKNDSYYFSKLLGDSVLLIGLDDGAGAVSEEQCDRLEEDIRSARKNHRIVLFFHHIRFTFLDKSQEANARLCKLLTENADVVKAVFAGHNHADIVGSVPASYTDRFGNTVECELPYYQLLGCPDGGETGNVLRIFVR